MKHNDNDLVAFRGVRIFLSRAIRMAPWPFPPRMPGLIFMQLFAKSCGFLRDFPVIFLDRVIFTL